MEARALGVKSNLTSIFLISSFALSVLPTSVFIFAIALRNQFLG
jgi:hypothetical protein